MNTAAETFLSTVRLQIQRMLWKARQIREQVEKIRENLRMQEHQDQRPFVDQGTTVDLTEDEIPVRERCGLETQEHSVHQVCVVHGCKGSRDQVHLGERETPTIHPGTPARFPEISSEEISADSGGQARHLELQECVQEFPAPALVVQDQANIVIEGTERLWILGLDPIERGTLR